MVINESGRKVGIGGRFVGIFGHVLVSCLNSKDQFTKPVTMVNHTTTRTTWLWAWLSN